MGFKIENSKLIKYTEEKGITSVTIPNGVTTIGQYVFVYCSNLESVTIPNSVTKIEDYAFSYCSNLKSITIPETLTDISKDAFNWCSPHLKIIKRKTDSEKEERNYCLGEKVNVEPDYKELFIKLFYAKELSDKENIFKQVNDESIKIPFAVFLFTEFESKTARDYIIKNSQKIMHYLVDENKMEIISRILPIINQK